MKQMSTHATADCAVAATSIDRELLARRHEDRELRNLLRKAGINLVDLPLKVRNYLWDIGRKEPRNAHPFGRYPEVADVLAAHGASSKAVFAPLTAIEAEITGRHYARNLPSLEEAQHTETNANRDFDHCQLNVAAGELTQEEIDAAVEAGNAQIHATKTELARLESLRSRAR